MSTTLIDADALLSGVRSALGADGIMGWTAIRHCGRARAVAVRCTDQRAGALFLEGYRAILERAGFTVEREPGWLTVSTR